MRLAVIRLSKERLAEALGLSAKYDIRQVTLDEVVSGKVLITVAGDGLRECPGELLHYELDRFLAGDL